jgi:hypothetical protein
MENKYTTHLTNNSLFKNMTGYVNRLLDLLLNEVTLDPALSAQC